MGVFDSGYEQALIDADRQPVETPPAGFLETFLSTWESTRQEDLSISESLNLGRHRQTRREKIKELTGEDISFLEGQAIPQLGLAPEGRARFGTESVKKYQAKIAEVSARYPEIRTDEEILTDITEESRRIRERTEKVLENTTFGGKLGSFAGAMAAATTDPLVLASMAFGASASATVLRTALTEAGIGALSEAMIQPFVWRYKKKLESPYDLEEALTRVAGAGVGSGLLAGTIKGAARGIARLRKPRLEGLDDLVEAFETRIKDPTVAERDAAHVLGDYADTLRENPFEMGDPAADMRHLEATAKAMGDVEAGRPVDVRDIVGDLEPREELRGEPVFVRESGVTPRRGPGIEEPTPVKPLEPAGGELKEPNLVVFERGAKERRLWFLRAHAKNLSLAEKTPFDDIFLLPGAEAPLGARVGILETEVRRPVATLNKKLYQTLNSGWISGNSTSLVSIQNNLPNEIIKKINETGLAHARLRKPTDMGLTRSRHGELGTLIDFDAKGLTRLQIKERWDKVATILDELPVNEVNLKDLRIDAEKLAEAEAKGFEGHGPAYVGNYKISKAILDQWESRRLDRPSPPTPPVAGGEVPSPTTRALTDPTFERLATAKAMGDVEAGRPVDVQDFVRGVEPREELAGGLGIPRELDFKNIEIVAAREGDLQPGFFLARSPQGKLRVGDVIQDPGGDIYRVEDLAPGGLGNIPEGYALVEKVRSPVDLPSGGGVTAKARTPATENQSLGQFVKNRGGVSIELAGDLRGEYDALFEQGGRKAGVVKRHTGKSPDELAQAAHEAGFIAEPDPALLAEALGRDLTGEKVFSTQGERFQRRLDIQIDREFEGWAEGEYKGYLAELESRARAILEEGDLEISMVARAEEGELVPLAGREAAEAVERGEATIVTRSAKEFIEEADADAKAGDILTKCLLGG